MPASVFFQAVGPIGDDGKPYRVFFAKEPYRVCFCFTHPVEQAGGE